MRRGARIATNVLTLGIAPLVRFVRKIVANRKAVKAGQPKPYPVGDLVLEALDTVGEAAVTVAGKSKNAK